MLAWVDGQRRSVLFIFFLTPGPQQLNQPTSIVWTRAISLDLERDTELTGSCLRGGARPSQHVLLWPPTALLWSAAQRSCLERRRYWEEHYPSRADKECTQSKIRFHKGTKHSLWGKIHIWFTGRDTAFDWILVWTLFFYYSGTVARLYPWFFFFMSDLCTYGPYLAILHFYFTCHAWCLVEATWSACLMWAKVITAIAITIITYGFSTSRQIANQKASMVGFQTVDFGDTIPSSAGSKLHASRSIDHLGQVIRKLVSVNGYNLVIISFRP